MNPPHPLPQEREQLFLALGTLTNLISDESTGVQKLLPLPGGEGRGEGEHFIALNSYGLTL
jgi:hypothetical protein